MAFLVTEGSFPNIGANLLRDAAAFGGTIVTVGDGGKILRSTNNGVSWTQPTSPSTNNWAGIATDGAGTWVIVGSGAGLRTAVSVDDGATWAANASADETAAWKSVCWADTLNLFVAVASSGTTRTMNAAAGVTWSGVAAATAKQWLGVCWSSDLGLLIAGAFDTSTTSLMSSTNATSWSSVTSGATWSAQGGSGSSVIAWVSSLGAFAEFVRASGVYGVATSTTGTSGWTLQTIPNSSEAPDGLVAAPSIGLFVLVKGCYPNVGNPMSLITADSPTAWAETEYTEIQDVTSWPASCWDDSRQLLVAFDNSTVYKTLLAQWSTLGVVTPDHGPKTGGNVVTVHGTGLSGITAVTFGGTAATDVVPASDGLTLTCIAPAHAVGAVTVAVA